jgi:ribosome recycling factor
MSEKVINDLEEKMNKSLNNLQGDLNKVRTGRASLALFDDIRMDYYGTVPESRLIIIQPWDPNMIGEIEKAILKSELGVTPTNDGKIIRLTIPRLTEERRKELVKKNWLRSSRRWGKGVKWPFGILGGMLTRT